MAHFTLEEKAFFKRNGYVVKPGLLTQTQIEKAADVLWDHIEADRNDPKTWINAGPKGNLPCSNHPDIAATTQETPVYEMAEELLGTGRLRPPGNPLCKMIYPTGHDNWQPPRGHLDGYTVEGVASTFTIGVTINISDILPRGGGFTTWAGSHVNVARYFQTHSLLTGWDINRGAVPELADPPGRYEHAAPAGAVCFWHHYMLHSASINCQDTIRMALVARFHFTNLNEIMFDLPHDVWGQWDGLQDVA